MERLLSEQEMKDHLPTGFDPEPCDLAMCVAQLAKADKEWVEWLLENLFRETDYGLEWQTTPRVALKRLAERKLEIGI